MPNVSRRWYRRWVAVLAVLVIAVVVVVVRREHSGRVAGAVLGWGARWPVRGDLAADRDLLSAAVGGSWAARPDGQLHVLWAGNVQRGDGAGRHVLVGAAGLRDPSVVRSEERRVGKECRSRWSTYH